MNQKQLRELIDALAEGGWDQASIVTDEFTLTVGSPPEQAAPVHRSRGGEPERNAPAPADGSAKPSPEPAHPHPSAPSGTIVTAPSVGVAWRSPKPGAAPFVEVGHTLAAGDTVVLLEVMKLFTPVVSEVSGIVRAILIDDGSMVEFGSPLVEIEVA